MASSNVKANNRVALASFFAFTSDVSMAFVAIAQGDSMSDNRGFMPWTGAIHERRRVVAVPVN